MEPELCVRSFKVQDVEPRVGKEEGQDSDEGLALSTTSCSKAEPKKSKNSWTSRSSKGQYLPK